MVSNRRHNRLRPAGEFLLKTTMLAAVAVSAWVGGYKLHEGLDRPDVSAVDIQGFSNETVARTTNEVTSNAADTFIDLTVGVGGLGLSGLLILGGVSRRLSMAEDSIEEKVAPAYASAYTSQPVSPVSYEVSFDPAAFGWLDPPVHAAAS
jgi:hypothetical protein